MLDEIKPIEPTPAVKPDPIVFKPDTVMPSAPVPSTAIAVKPAATDAFPVLHFEGASVSQSAKQLIVGGSVYDLSEIRDIRFVVGSNGVPATWLISTSNEKVGEIPELNARGAFLAVQNALLPITRANGGD